MTVHLVTWARAECQSCGKLSEPVALDWVEPNEENYEMSSKDTEAFSKAGWDVEEEHSWCPSCKTITRGKHEAPNRS